MTLAPIGREIVPMPLADATQALECLREGRLHGAAVRIRD